MMTPKTLRAPAPAPSVASDRAKQSASFAIRTGRPSASARSRSRARSLSQVELALRMRPVKGDREPGVPTPILPLVPVSDSTAATKAAIAARVPG